MVATTTINGHVFRAVAFQARTDIWLGVGRTTPWDEAQLIGTVAAVAGNFTITDTSVTFLIDINSSTGLPEYTVDVTLPSGSQTISTILSTINARWTAVGGSGTLAYSEVVGSDTFIKIKTPTTGQYAMVMVDSVDDNADIGFAADTVQYGYDLDPPPSAPSTEEVEEIVGYKRYDVNELVVPDADTAAELTGTVAEGAGFDTNGPPTDYTFDLEVDDLGSFVVNLTPGATVPIATIINDINGAYQAQFLAVKGYATADTVASDFLDGLDHYVKLTSPNPGGTSKVEVGADGSTALGFTALSSSTGHAGGSITYRDTQWRIVSSVNAYDEGARWVYLEANLNYDDFPLEDVRQFGWYSDLDALPAYVGHDPLEVEGRDTTTGILEVVDNRRVVNRASDEYEVIKIVIEF